MGNRKRLATIRGESRRRPFLLDGARSFSTASTASTASSDEAVDGRVLWCEPPARLTARGSGVIGSFTHAPAEDVTGSLRACVDVPDWADLLLAGRPYSDIDDVVRRADYLARMWSHDDVLRALAAHPRIGERSSGLRVEAALSAREQGGVIVDQEVTHRLRAGNIEYERRFDHVFSTVPPAAPGTRSWPSSTGGSTTTTPPNWRRRPTSCATSPCCGCTLSCCRECGQHARPRHVVYAADRPYGLIEATVLREGVPTADSAWAGIADFC